MFSYNYSIINDTENSLLNSDTLTQSINDSTISQNVDNITTNGDVLTINFQSSLTTAEETTLTSVINNHDGIANSETPELEIDDDGRQIHKTAATYRGWRYLAHPIEITTSKLGSLFSKDWQGNDRNNIDLKFYDSNDVELVAGTQIELDNNCVKTEITFAPSYDYDIIGGNVHQNLTPTENIRLWVIAGAVDLKHLPGTVTEFIGGLNMKFINPGDHIETDGRASARLNYTTEGLPVPTNKMQYIIDHPVGHQHDIMIVVEFFRS